MDKEKRIVGGYEVKQAFRFGGKEILLGENLNEPNGNYYMCCFAERNAFYERYIDAIACDDYTKIAELYALRITEQVEKMKEKIKSFNIDTSLITPEMCDSIDGRDLENEVIVLKPTSLKAEYRHSPYQILYCKGGNGARHDGRGQSVFADEVYSRENMRYDRCDIMGILKKECYPEWVQPKVEFIREFKGHENVFRYGDYHFIGFGYLPKNKKEVDKHIRKNTLGISSYKDATTPYKYDDFYDAAGNMKFDVFKCYETGKNYVPGQNELFEYDGDVREKKFEKNKEMER